MKERIKDIIIIVFPLTIVLTFLIQLKWHSASILDWLNLYGLFYPISSDAIGSSFNYEYYIKGLLITIIIFGIFSYFLNYFLIKQIVNRLIKRRVVIVIWIVFLLLVLPKIIIINYSDFMWDYDKTSKFESKTFYMFNK